MADPSTSVTKQTDAAVRDDAASDILKKGVVVSAEDLAALQSAELRQHFPLLANLSEEELERLNKAVLRKLDWRFLPGISLMLLMK